MKDLPLDLLDEILFKLERKSLAMIRCTNKYFQSYLSDPKFEKYIFWARHSFFDISRFGSCHIFCQPWLSSCNSMSLEKTLDLMFTIERCYIFGSCSGLVLLFIGGLFIANPITKSFRILDYSGSQLIPKIFDGDGSCPKNNIARMERATCVGFAVNQTTMRFKIVCIIEMKKKYAFEISDGYSWRLSETTITTISNSKLMTRMKPVYLDGTLHWLRKDGSIIAFNPETEQARLIPFRFHEKLFLAVDDEINRLTLISGTIKTISVYTLLGDSKWALTKRIKNISMDKTTKFLNWDVIAYDGKCLVVREMKKDILRNVAHVYDIEANSWRVMGSAIYKYATVQKLYKITPSLFFVEEDEQQKVVVASNDQRIALTAILRLIDTTRGVKMGHILWVNSNQTDSLA